MYAYALAWSLPIQYAIVRSVIIFVSIVLVVLETASFQEQIFGSVFVLAGAAAMAVMLVLLPYANASFVTQYFRGLFAGLVFIHLFSGYSRWRPQLSTSRRNNHRIITMQLTILRKQSCLNDRLFVWEAPELYTLSGLKTCIPPLCHHFLYHRRFNGRANRPIAN